MRNYLPPRPTGTTPQARFNQWVWDRLAVSLNFINSSTVSFSQTSKGVMAEAATSTPSSSPTTRQGPFQIQSVQDDYLTCFPYDNSTQKTTSTTPVYIAKEDKHQTDLASETIFGVVHNYTYQSGLTPPSGLGAADANNIFRTDEYSNAGTDPSTGLPFPPNIEYQRIVPPWLCGTTGDIIYGDPTPGLAVDGADGKPITLLIAGRSCQWGQVLQ